MLIIPSIDLKEGKVVRLQQGKMDRCKIYTENPVEIACQFEKDGAQFIHIVDLDGATKGKLSNLKTVKKILKKINIPAQIGGGIRKEEDIIELINIGVKRVILSSLLFKKKKDFIIHLFQKYGDKIAVAVDANAERLAVSGWQEITNTSAEKWAKKMEGLGAKRIIYTDIKRDGMLKGINLAGVKKMIKSIKIPIIVSGGVSSLQDIINLSNLKVEGVIIGRAIYEGKIDLKETIKVQKNRSGQGLGKT